MKKEYGKLTTAQFREFIDFVPALLSMAHAGILRIVILFVGIGFRR